MLLEIYLQEIQTDERPNLIGKCIRDNDSNIEKINCLRCLRSMFGNPFYQRRIDRFIDAIAYLPTGEI